MSDFGAIIKFKKNGEDISEENIESIKSALKTVINTEEYPSNITEGNFENIIGWDENTYASLITEYYDGEDAQEIREFAEDDDIQDCNRIVSSLTNILGSDYEISTSFEDW